MVVLGALVVVLAVLLTVGVAADNPGATSAEAFGRAFDGVSTGELFLLGVTTGVAGALGLVLFVSGLARRRARRVALKDDAKAARSERESLEEENARLQAELEHSREASSVYPADPHASDPGHVEHAEGGQAVPDSATGHSERGRHRLIGG